jgi:hypothetical protein
VEPPAGWALKEPPTDQKLPHRTTIDTSDLRRIGHLKKAKVRELGLEIPKRAGGVKGKCADTASVTQRINRTKSARKPTMGTVTPGKKRHLEDETHKRERESGRKDPMAGQSPVPQRHAAGPTALTAIRQPEHRATGQSSSLTSLG